MADINADTTTESSMGLTFARRLQRTMKMRFQQALDRSTPHLAGRWIGFVVLFLIFARRVYVLQGFYIVAYACGIYILNLLIGFLSPIEDPEGDGPLLPTSDRSEFKPFARRLPEFKFWYSCSKSVFISIICTFFKVLDVPVFAPILVIYFIVLFVLTMKRQIRHMIQHKYIPFSFGKKRYTAKAPPTSAAASKVAAKMGKAG